MQDTLTHAPTEIRGMVIPMPGANTLAAMVRPEPLHLAFPVEAEAPALGRAAHSDVDAVLAEIDDLLIL
jgi:hypothetical protein